MRAAGTLMVVSEVKKMPASGEAQLERQGSGLDLFEVLAGAGHEKIVVCNDPAVGLQAIIAIHSTALGPANGGVRMFPYASFTDAARDALRLSEAMTYKWAAAGENRGGGKAVICGDPARDKSEALLRSFGRYVERLAGEYYAGEDVGLTLHDMETIHVETDYVATLPVEAGGIGDIAPWTARGTVNAMRACAHFVWGSRELKRRTVAVQGLGACGSAAVAQLVATGADVLVSDIDEARVDVVVAKHHVKAIEPEQVYDADVDIFAPYAMGAIIDDHTIPRLKAKVVAGSANNILARPEHADALDARGIVYAPDFIANAGGAIYDAEQFRKGGFSIERATRNVDAIEGRVWQILNTAHERGQTAQAVAHSFARERLDALETLRSEP